jgi:hypothetical protein
MDWAAVAHPQTNRQVDHANGMILLKGYGDATLARKQNLLTP